MVEVRFLERNLMRMPLCWNLPNPDENEQFKMPQEDVFLQEVLDKHLEICLRHLFSEVQRWSGDSGSGRVTAVEEDN